MLPYGEPLSGDGLDHGPCRPHLRLAQRHLRHRLRDDAVTFMPHSAQLLFAELPKVARLGPC